jgi:hypothetical protein
MLVSVIVLELCWGVKINKGQITPKLGKIKLWFFCTALPPIEIYLSTKFHVVIFYAFRVIRAITPKLCNTELWFFSTALMRSIYLQSFMLIPLVFSKLCEGQE